MKILHININELSGGAAQAANRLHHELLKHGADSKLLVVNKESNDNTVIKVKDLYSKRDKLILLIRKVSNILSIILFVKKDKRFNPPSLLLSVLDRYDFDILHLHWVTEELVNFKELKNISRPIIWTMHDCAAFTGICHVIGSCSNYTTGCGKCPIIDSKSNNDISSKEFRRKQRLYKNLNLNLVSPSSWLAGKASLSPLLKSRPIITVPHGINTELFSPLDKLIARNVLNINPNAKIIICGAVTLKDKNKGIHHLRDAIKQISVSDVESGNIELLLFGDNPDEGISFSIKTTRLGYIKDQRLLRIVYSLADVMVVPSLQEAFGLTALEAMSCGTPVVAFAATGLLDLVEHKKNGYLAKPYIADDLATGIKWCIDNNNEKLLSINARNKVLDCYNLNSVGKRYEELYMQQLSI